MQPRHFLKGCLSFSVAWVAVTGTIGMQRLIDADSGFTASALASQATWVFAPPAILLALAGLLQTGQTNGSGPGAPRPEVPLSLERHWGSPGRGLRPPVRRL